MNNYYNIKAISQSQVCNFLTSAYDFWKHTPYNPDCLPDKKSKCMEQGSLAHCLLLERDSFNEKFFVSNYENFLSKKAGDEKESKESEGFIVIKNSDFEKANKMVLAIAKNRDANLLLENAIFEKELFATYHVDEYRTLDIKGKPDAFKKYTNGDIIIIDYKTVNKGIETFIRSIPYEHKYIQLAMYSKLVKLNYPDVNNIYFKYIIQSTKENEEDKILIIGYDNDFIEYAKEKLHATLYSIRDYFDEFDKGRIDIWDYRYDNNPYYEISLPKFINN